MDRRKKWKIKNPECVREYKLKWYHNNSERINRERRIPTNRKEQGNAESSIMIDKRGCAAPFSL